MPGMAGRLWHIGLALGILGAFLAVSVVKWKTLILKQEVRALGAQVEILRKGIVKGDGTAVPADAPEKQMTLGNYRVAIPASWTYTSGRNEIGTEYIVSDGRGQEVARGTCPPPETGFEVWTFETRSRVIYKGSEFDYDTYVVEVNFGTEYDPRTFQPIIGDGTRDINLFSITRSTGDEAADWKQSCFMAGGGTPEMDAAFLRLYESAALVE